MDNSDLNVCAHRFYFKKVSTEFDCGVVFEEVRDDDAILPIFEEKIVGKVEKVDWNSRTECRKDHCQETRWEERRSEIGRREVEKWTERCVTEGRLLCGRSLRIWKVLREVEACIDAWIKTIKEETPDDAGVEKQCKIFHLFCLHCGLSERSEGKTKQGKGRDSCSRKKRR